MPGEAAESCERHVVSDFVGMSDHEHAPSRRVIRSRAVDLEPDDGTHERGTELRPGSGPEHDRALEHHVVDGQDHGQRADTDRDPSEALAGEQAEAFFGGEVTERQFGHGAE